MRSLAAALSCLLLLSAAPAFGDDERDAKTAGVLLAGFGFVASVDMLQTSYCLGARTCAEANPVTGYAVHRLGPVKGLALKGAVHTVSIYALARHRKKSPRAVKWAAVGLLAVQTYVDVHNWRQLRRVR